MSGSSTPTTSGTEEKEHNFNWHPSATDVTLAVAHGEAVKLIEVRDQEKDSATLLLTPRGKLILEKICATPTKLHVIVIVGQARSGKSSWLNWFLQYLFKPSADSIVKNFDVSPGTKTVTSGMWMWSQLLSLPSQGTKKSDEKILLLDTEGTQRGRDSVTSIITALGCSVATCVALNVRNSGAGLTTSVLEFSDRLANEVSRIENAVGSAVEAKEGSRGRSSRNLIYRCADIRPAWRTSVGDLGRYLKEKLVEHPVTSSVFGCALSTTDRPTDDDLSISATSSTDSSFFSDLKFGFDFLLDVLHRETNMVNSGELPSKLEAYLSHFTSEQGKMIPALIERIQRQEVEQELRTCVLMHAHYSDKRRRCIPYFSLDSVGTEIIRPWLEEDKAKEMKYFRESCERLSIMPRLVEEYTVKLETQLRTKMQELYNEKLTHDAKLRREKEEADRLKREAELKRQAEEKKTTEAKLQAERERLYQIQQEQTRQQMTLLQIHANIVSRDLNIEREVSGALPLGTPFRWIYTTCPCCPGRQYRTGWHKI